MIGKFGFTLAAAFALLLIAAPPAFAQTDLTELYRQILRNPQDTELNLRYARAAEAQGQVQRAIAALERIIVNDPENEVARNEIGRLRALVAKPETKYSVTVGSLYESNMARTNPRIDSFDGWGIYGKGSVTHEQTFGNRRYVFDGQVYSRYNNRYDQGALDFIAVQAAPIYYAFDGWRLTPGIGLAYARLDRDPYFGSAYMFVNADATDEGVWRQVRGRISIDDYGNRYDFRDGAVFATDTTLAWTQVLRTGDQILLRPEFILSKAKVPSQDYYGVTLRTIYATPIEMIEIPHVKGVTGVVYLTTELRGYDKQAGAVSPGRHDYRYNPGVQLIFKDVYRPGLSITAGYGYEKNLSRSFVNEYSTHTVSVAATWRF